MFSFVLGLVPLLLEHLIRSEIFHVVVFLIGVSEDAVEPILKVVRAVENGRVEHYNELHLLVVASCGEGELVALVVAENGALSGRSCPWAECAFRVAVFAFLVPDGEGVVLVAELAVLVPDRLCIVGRSVEFAEISLMVSTTVDLERLGLCANHEWKRNQEKNKKFTHNCFGVRRVRYVV